MTFEEKIRLLASTPPGKKKQELLNKFTFGDVEFASRYFVDAVPLSKYMEINAERFKHVAAEAAELRKNTRNRGWTDKKYQKFRGLLPDVMQFERLEFSTSLPKAERERNLQMFFEQYPAFRVDE